MNGILVVGNRVSGTYVSIVMVMSDFGFKISEENIGIF